MGVIDCFDKGGNNFFAKVTAHVHSTVDSIGKRYSTKIYLTSRNFTFVCMFREYYSSNENKETVFQSLFNDIGILVGVVEHNQSTNDLLHISANRAVALYAGTCKGKVTARTEV